MIDDSESCSIEIDRMQYTGYFHDTIADNWNLLSRIEVNTGGSSFSIDGLYAFVEQWTGTDPQDTRGGVFGPGWMSSIGGSGGWQEVTDVSFSYGLSENHLHVNAYESDPYCGYSCIDRECAMWYQEGGMEPDDDGGETGKDDDNLNSGASRRGFSAILLAAVGFVTAVVDLE